MRTFAQKPKATQHTTSAKSTIPGRAHFGQSREVSSILHLQRAIGNQAVQRLLQSNAEELETGSATTTSTRFGRNFSTIPLHPKTRSINRPKLTVSTQRDIYEQEADRVAARVMQMTGPTGVADRARGASVVNDGNTTPNTGHGGALDPGVRAYFESRLGHDFSRVRVHAGPEAAQVAESLGAKALTVGRDIVFARGTYAPHTTDGRALLAHELVHVVQQSPTHHEGEHGLAKTVSRGAEGLIQRAVGHVGCRNATGRVREIVGDDPVGTVRVSDARAIELLDGAIGDLAYTSTQIRDGEPAAWPTIQDSVAVGLRDRFGLDPEDSEIWTTSRRHTRADDPSIRLLLIRLRAVRRTLASGGVRYECLTRPPCPPMSGPNEVVLGADAYGEGGGNTITLCEGFWRTERSLDDRASMLIHEAFHLYFVGIDVGRNMWNAHCIDQFVADVHGIPIQEDYEGACG